MDFLKDLHFFRCARRGGSRARECSRAGAQRSACSRVARATRARDVRARETARCRAT